MLTWAFALSTWSKRQPYADRFFLWYMSGLAAELGLYVMIWLLSGR